MIFQISKRAFNGACVLSAVGSLPMHVMPVLIASAILADRVSVAQAGLFAAMYSLGQLFITTLLPLLSVRYLRGSWAFQVSLLLVIVIFLSAHLTGKLFYVNWFFIGLFCGMLSYLGSTSAAAVENKSVAYAVRLGVTLLIAGFTMLVFYVIDKFAGFVQLTATLAMVVTILCVVGLALYKSPVLCVENALSENIPKPKAVSSYDGNVRWGLIYIFIFSFAQVGFIVFAIESAINRGIDIGDALWVFALCKIGAAFLLLSARHRKRNSNINGTSYLFTIPVLTVACFSVASAHTLVLFFIGVLLWETSVNVMSSSFQASVVEANPAVGGMYLTSVLLFGSAFGPIANGVAISSGFHQYFNFLVLLSIFIPLIWVSHKDYFNPPLGLRNTGETK